MRMAHLPLDLRADGTVGFDHTHALRLLGDSKWARRGGKIANLIAAVSMANDLYQQVASWRRQLRESRSYTITVSSQDSYLYAVVHPWILKQLPEPDRRSMSASFGYEDPVEDDEDRPDEVEQLLGNAAPQQRQQTVRFQYDGNREVEIEVGGHPVKVFVDRGRDEVESEGYSSFRFKREDRIVFTAASLAAQQALMDHLVAMVKERYGARDRNQKRPPNAFRATRYGQWAFSRALQARDSSTVVLADGLLDEIIAEVRKFLGNEKKYTALGLPYHWGCLLHGPPGSGKSTTVLQVARALDLPVYFVPLTDLKDDSTLSELLEDLPERCILLFEDVDYTAATGADRQDSERVSGEGLLQALDGAITRHGQIVFMTTNVIADLDPAIYRPGRCNKVLEIGYLTDEQLAGIVAAFTGRTDPLPPLGDRRVVPATITTLIAEHIEDLDAAHAAVVRYLEGENGDVQEADEERGLVAD